MALDPQSIITFAAGAGGALSTVKLIQFIAGRRRDEGPAETPGEHERLFPNGEKDQIIQRLDELAQQNRDDRREYLAFRSEMRGAIKNVREDVGSIADRLDKAGIA